MGTSKQKTQKSRGVARQAPGISVICFDFQVFLKKITGIGEWKEVNGPDSGVGLDYWYRAGNHDAYVNIDQGFMTVSIDKEVVFQGSADQARCKEG